MKRYLWFVLCCSVLLAALSAPALAAGSANPNPGVIPLNAKVGGLTYADWGDRWWQWVFSIPADDNPLLDLTGEKAAIGQSGDVFFLVGLWNPAGQATVERWVTVPRNTTLFLPTINYVWWKAEVCQCDLPREEMIAVFYSALDWAVTNTVAELRASVDGQPLQELFQYRATSPRAFVGQYPENSIISIYPEIGTDPGVLDTIVADGYWLMLAPLKKGEHVVTFGGTYAWGDSLDVTYHITVK